MNAKNLFQQNGCEFVPTRVWACQCGVVAQTKEAADACCVPRLCQCGNPLNPHFGICDDCLNAQHAVQEIQRERDRYSAAEKLTDYDGPVFDGNYYEDLEAFFEHWEDVQGEGKGGDRPTYVWACRVRPMVNLDTDDVTGSIEFPDEPEMSADELEGLPELQAALEAFNKANERFTLWDPDYTRAVVLSWPEET